MSSPMTSREPTSTILTTCQSEFTMYILRVSAAAVGDAHPVSVTATNSASAAPARPSRVRMISWRRNHHLRLRMIFLLVFKFRGLKGLDRVLAGLQFGFGVVETPLGLVEFKLSLDHAAAVYG